MKHVMTYAAGVVLVVIVGVIVGSGVSSGWTAAHFWIGGPLALLAVVALTPTKRPVRADR